MQNFLVKDPNFSIIVPGPCNAQCSFCFWKQQIIADFYLLKLQNTLNNIPKEFTQISLTGGEPCLSYFLIPILQTIDKKRFPKVVLTTNGTSLFRVLEKHSLLIKDKIKYINISRHHYIDNNNRKIFGTESVPDKFEIKKAINLAKNLGIETTINCVISEKTMEQDIYSMIGFVHEVGAKNICFRKQHGSLEPTEIEKCFSKHYPIITEGGCPVCRSKLQKILGTNVSWKASSIEPSKEGDGIFEAVFHPNGNLTADWNGNIELNFNDEDNMNKKVLAKIADALISIGNELKNLAEDNNEVEKSNDSEDLVNFPKYDDNDFPSFSDLKKEIPKKTVKGRASGFPEYDGCYPAGDKHC